MDDGFLSKFRAADIADLEWEQRVAVIRRTRSYELALQRGDEHPELVEDLDDSARPSGPQGVWERLQTSVAVQPR